MSDKPPQKTIKVVDRRWFTADGELRELPPEDAAGSPKQPPLSADPAAFTPADAEAWMWATAPATGGPAEGEAAPPVTEPPPQGEGQASGAGADPGMLALIDALAQPAAALLTGQVRGRGRDLHGARYYIDLLGVLRSRVGSNLSPEELRYLDDVLFQLRSLFVAASR